MRITNGMLSTSFLGDMNRNLNQMQTIQKQLTSGKEFSRPSDNPFKVARSMQMYSEIYANKQFNSNIKDTINWMDTTDSALNQATNTMQRVRELMVSAGNAAYGSSQFNAIKDEINEKVAEFGQILNTSFDGKYIFGGTDGTIKPITVSTSDMNFIDKDGKTITIKDANKLEPVTNPNVKNKLEVEISPGVKVEYNVNASEITEYDTGKNMTTLFENILKHLSDNSQKGEVTGSDLKEMDSAINKLLELSSKVGTVQNRMESSKALNEEQNFNMTEILSANEDIDLVEKTMEFATMQTIYMASLQTSAKVLQPSLIDYLR
ncbi:flagellar hook-associated protein FlgL [Clostridium tunisiense]|uniref:flagellar hook-associated protein FlgL n=1 Tax=Clostridium tunisiense TaxID=219748 RepID=UPI00030F75EF|nr:flagellar hook-associated protein FlgL [Clostridium tunisiense]